MSTERRLSHYAILDKVGEGGMGVLFRARDTKLDRTVAIKVLRDDGGLDPLQRRRFVQEARAASALNHPNIVTIYEIGRDEPGGGDFIVMEFVEGRALSAAMAAGPLPPLDAIRLALPMAGALAAAHAAGIVHRDVKPANVMVTSSGQVKVLDFGLAKLQAVAAAGPGGGDDTVTTGPLTTDGMILGTPAYMSPEQAQGRPVDASSDVFSLGTTLYEMLAGRRPFTGDNPVALLSSILRDEPPPLRALQPAVPRELERLVQQCLAKDAARRPAAGVVARELAELEKRLTHAPGGVAALLGRKSVAVPVALVLVAAIAGGAWWWRRSRQVRHAREVVLPEIARLAEHHDGVARAFALAQEVQPLVGDDPGFKVLLADVALPIDLVTEPAGALVSYKPYLDPGAPWRPLGRTPQTGVRVPETHLRWRFEADGYTPAEAAIFSLKMTPVTLTRTGDTPVGMVHVPAGQGSAFGMRPASTGSFWLDRYEVTNAAYKQFVDAGGYRRPEWWKEPVVVDGRALAFEEAMALFVDRTGQPGPSGWELGEYPPGQGDVPVGGVSWYEAAAFAEFSGKSLPTVHHWFRAAGPDLFSEILRFSNFGGRGPQPVGSNEGLGPFGTYDMAGNVREWCWNSSATQRYALGGAWSDPTYMFTSAEALPPLDRSAPNGFRLARYVEPPSAETLGVVEFQVRDYARVVPADDSVFAAYRSQFDYDRTDLAPRVEAVDDAAEHWRRETVTIAGAYGRDRLKVHVFLPRNARPPYQVVLYSPPGSAWLLPSSDLVGNSEFGFLVRSGRAMVFPVYSGYYERRLPASVPRGPALFRETVIQQVKDARRALDYALSRPDVRKDGAGYYGLSTGAAMGVLLGAVEGRLKALVLVSGGLPPGSRMPEIDGVNFAPRVTAPTLLATGRYDFLSPPDKAQVPLYRLLGSAPADKKHFLFEGGHVPPNQQEVIRETLAWLDRHLGPVAF